MDLQIIRAAVKPSKWREWLNAWLDKYIALDSDKNRIYQRARRTVWAWGILMLLEVNLMRRGFFAEGMLLPFMMFIIALWDYVASRRWLAEEKAARPGIRTQAPADDEQKVVASAPTMDEMRLPTAQSPLSVIEATTRRLETVPAQLQEEAKIPKL